MSPRFFSKRKIVCFLKAYDCFFNVIFPISYEKKSNIKNWQTQEWLFELTSFWIMTLRKISIGNCKYKYFPHEKFKKWHSHLKYIFAIMKIFWCIFQADVISLRKTSFCRATKLQFDASIEERGYIFSKISFINACVLNLFLKL